MGAVVELSGSADMSTSALCGGRRSRSTSSVALPSAIADVSEVIVVAGGTGGARVLSRGGTAVWMELQAGVSGGWTRVWTTTLGEGSCSVDGLHVRFDAQEVAGVRFGSDPKAGPSFDGWGDVVLHFGRSVGAGA